MYLYTFRLFCFYLGIHCFPVAGNLTWGTTPNQSESGYLTINRWGPIEDMLPDGVPVKIVPMMEDRIRAQSLSKYESIHFLNFRRSFKFVNSLTTVNRTDTFYYI